MKILIVILLLLSVIGWLGYKSFYQTLQGMQNCTDAATVRAQNDLSWLSQGKPTTGAMCERARAQYAELSSCYKTLEKRYFFPTALVETIMVRQYVNFPVLARNRAFLSRACPS